MKRITALICAMLSFFAAASNVFADRTAAADMGTLTEKEESFVEALGFMDNISEGYISKKNYALAVLRASGHIEQGEVVADKALADMARSNRILPVYDDGDAGLYEKVTYIEVLSGLIRILGYDVTIDGSSGAIRKCAESLGIACIAQKADGDNVTGKEMAKMLCRACEADIITVSGFAGAEVTFEKREGRTLLEECHDIYSIRGTVTGNENTTLSNTEGLAKDTVCIDGKLTLNTGKTDAMFYLGYAVKCYYKIEDDDSMTAVWIDRDKKCTDIFLERDEIVSYKNFVYEYEDKNRCKKAELSANVSVIYNSKSIGLSELSESQIIPQVGDVTLIDGDSDGKYEVLIIMDYDSYIAGGANDEYIVDIKGNPILDISDIDYKIYDKNYKQMRNDAVLANSVAWIGISADGELATVLVSTDNVTGIIESVENDDKKIVAINGAEYTVSKKCDNDENVKLGLGAVFYLDIAGNIAGFRAQANADMKYGYLIRTAPDDDDENVLMLKIFDGSFKVLKCAERVKINNSVKRTPEAITAEFCNEQTGFESQIIRYRTNSDEQITVIETAKIPEVNEEITNRLFLEAEIPKTSTGDKGVYYVPSYEHFVTYYFAFDSASKIFCIPDNLADESAYKLISPDLLAEGALNGMKAYKTNKNDDYCCVGVYRDSVMGIDKTRVAAKGAYVVSDIETTINEDDEPIIRLKCYSGLSEKTYTVDDEDIVEIITKNVHVGDIVAFDINSLDNTLTTFRKDYDYATNSVMGTMKSNNSYTADYMLYGGKVVQKMTNSVKLSRNPEDIIGPYIVNDFVPFAKTSFIEYKVSRGRLIVTSGAMNNVYIGDNMVYTSINGQPRAVFLVKK